MMILALVIGFAFLAAGLTRAWSGPKSRNLTDELFYENDDEQ